MIFYVGNPKESYKKTPTTKTSKWVEQGCKIQDQHPKITHITLHSQLTCENKDNPISNHSKENEILSCMSNKACTAFMLKNYKS